MSFIKSIDSSSIPLSSNILASAVINEIQDRNNAITLAIQNEMKNRDSAIVQQISVLPTKSDISSMIGNSITNFSSNLTSTNIYTTAPQVATQIVGYNYLNLSQVTNLINTFSFQTLSQIQNLGYQTFNNISSLNYQTASSVTSMITNFGYTTTQQVNTLISTANGLLQSAILSTANKFTALNTFDKIQVNTMQINGTANSVLLNQSSNSGSYSTAVGVNSLNASNAQFNTGIGYGSLILTTQSYNTGIGAQSLLHNITGSNNCGLGLNAGTNSISGNSNTYLGTNTSTTLTSCSGSTAIGYGAIINSSNQIMLGTNNETVVFPGFLQQTTTPSLIYTLLPTFTPNQIGYQTTVSAGKSFSLKTGATNTETIQLPVGIWHLGFRFELYNPTNVPLNGFLNYGLSNGSTGYQQYTQSIFNVDQNITYPFSNTCIVKSTNLLYTLVVILPSQVLNPTNYTVNGQFIATRIA